MKVETITKTTITCSDGRKFKDMAAAEHHEFMIKQGAVANAWMDLHGMSTGKGGRRGATLTALSKWEADKASGVLANLEIKVAEELAARQAAGVVLNATPAAPSEPVPEPIAA